MAKLCAAILMVAYLGISLICFLAVHWFAPVGLDTETNGLVGLIILVSLAGFGISCFIAGARKMAALLIVGWMTI